MISMIWDESVKLICPRVWCDICKKPIEKRGNVLYKGHVKINEEMFHTHKECYRDFRYLHGGDFLHEELDVFLFNLLHNSKIDKNKAEENSYHSAFMEPPRHLFAVHKSHATSKKRTSKSRTKNNSVNSEDLPNMPYHQYLKTPEWQTIRRIKLEESDYKCQVCYVSDETLDVHHRTYERRGRERLSDLTVLCRTCHQAHHKVAL